MTRCAAKTAGGAQCRVDALPGMDLCHIHNPEGMFRRQRPGMRVRRYDEGPSLPEVEAREDTDTRIRVYADGACRPNPGPGGWAWVRCDDGTTGSGSASRTTNQRMELTAALEAAKSNPDPLTVVTDSAYVVNCFRDGWWRRWAGNGWLRGRRGQPVANADLWQPLVELVVRRDVGFEWVKGHAGDPWNESADELAVSALEEGLLLFKN